MESTSCAENCPFVKTGFCSTEKECPNYVESWWIEGGKDGQPKLLKDCATKRLLLQQQYMQLRLEQMQASLDATRIEYTQLCNQLKQFVELGKMLITEKATQSIEYHEKTISNATMPFTH